MIPQSQSISQGNIQASFMKYGGKMNPYEEKTMNRYNLYQINKNI